MDINIQSEISILFYDSLPNPEFVWAIDKSEDFVGCTGDDSFSKVISMGKVPFYYAVGHKVPFKSCFNRFLKNQKFEAIYEIFDKFIDDKSGMHELFPTNNHLLKEFQPALSKVNYQLLKSEIDRFKKETIPLIRNEHSAFNNVLAALEKKGFVVPSKKLQQSSPEDEEKDLNKRLIILFRI